MAADHQKIADDNVRKYGTDIGRYGPTLLAHLYTERTHFIYELLQNAEDALARRAKVEGGLGFPRFRRKHPDDMTTSKREQDGQEPVQVRSFLASSVFRVVRG